MKLYKSVNLAIYQLLQKVDAPKVKTGKKIAVIGGGVAGLSAAWQLARKGHDVTVYDDDKHMGGKLEQVIPRARLSHELLQSELKRIEDMGVKFVQNAKLMLINLLKLKIMQMLLL